MTTKNKVILASVSLLTAFAFGRYTVPVKVKIETHTVEVEKKVDTVKTDTDRDKHKVTTVVQIEKPDGTKETTTKTEEDDQTVRKTTSKETETDQKSAETSKEIVRGTSPVTISLLGGIPVSFSSVTPVWGASVTKPVLGPITLGVWGLSSKEAGASLGLTF